MDVQEKINYLNNQQVSVNFINETTTTTLPVNEITQALAFRVRIQPNDDNELKSNLYQFIRNYSSAVDKKQDLFKVKIIERVKLKFLKDLAEFRKEKRFPLEIVEDVEKILTPKNKKLFK